MLYVWDERLCRVFSNINWQFRNLIFIVFTFFNFWDYNILTQFFIPFLPSKTTHMPLITLLYILITSFSSNGYCIPIYVYTCMFPDITCSVSILLGWRFLGLTICHWKSVNMLFPGEDYLSWSHLFSVALALHVELRTYGVFP